MSTIAEELTRIQNAKASLATSIAAKGVEVPAATKVDGYAALVDQIAQGGPTEPPMKALCFYDYDGTRLYSFDEDEVAAMTELPALPDHTDMGLVQEGWNWTLADIKTQIQLVGACDVGCTYATSDGKTWIKIRIDDENYMSPSLNTYNISSSNSVFVDWGDGSEATEYTTTPSHTYSSLGEYTIKIWATTGYAQIRGGCLFDGEDNSTIDSHYYRMCIKSVCVCGGKPTLGANAFFKSNLDYAIISKTAAAGINNEGQFHYTKLPVYILNGDTSGVTYLKSSMSNIITRVLCLNNFSGGVSFATSSYLLRKVLPYGAWMTNGALSSSYMPVYVYTVHTGSVNNYLAGNNVQKAYKVHCEGSSTISSTWMQNNYMLEEIEFREYDTVPTLANVSAFSGCPTGFKIIVPQSLYAEWKAATNWSTFAAYIYYRDSNGDLKQ